MEMKWNPIIDGDLSGIPRDEELLFTIFDEEDGKHMQLPVALKKVSTEI